MDGTGACIVQRDFTVLLEKEHPGFEQAKLQLARFAELVKSPALFHTYRITPLSLWNAAASGWTADDVVERLRNLARWEVPGKVVSDIRTWISRYGSLALVKSQDAPNTFCLKIRGTDPSLLRQLEKEPALTPFRLERDGSRLHFPAVFRGLLKQEMARLGYPIIDEAGYHSGHTLSLALRSVLPNGQPFALRDYQVEGVQAFAGSITSDGYQGNGGSGVIVLPCGAGKTVIGIAALERLQCETLILTSNVTSVRQWIAEICQKTTLAREEVGEYSGDMKQVRPVTVSTYQILTHRHRKEEEFRHMSLFNERDWGLIIYDEVHLLPAPVFRATADIQATRRLGLTATLVREDGCERDVFSLIGPKLYEVPWRDLEKCGYIAKVECQEIQVAMSPSLREEYEAAQGRDKFRIAAENPRKIVWLQKLLRLHEDRQVLIIGQYLQQLTQVAGVLHAPLITGSTPQEERVRLFQGFRERRFQVLVVSKVANFAVDLPDASVAVQISGSFGSRQEEAQRLGRILRPKATGDVAYFYSLVSVDSREQHFALRRQLFLVEQGYEYSIRPDDVSCLDAVSRREVL
ncbi:DNA repair helicase XPB [Paenibacillus lentus]|uniref:DNA 3'-5' helicase n=1 Tax=Paenibacillus lentus TaxID=1338368 RepID=A0A3S8RUW5_9BACL|nr:DNA repair helicase XPB [Paenibacillus lentus]AZK46975.1 helicase [Paenibacillus lentus]